MNGHTSSTESYFDRLELFRKSDKDRDSLVNEVLTKYEDLQIKYADTVSDLSNEIESRRLWQSKASLHERTLTEYKQASGSNSFVLVVIDGDGAPFADHLYARETFADGSTSAFNEGRDGGSDAAYQLHSDIKQNLKSTYPDAPVDDWNIVVQVVLSLQGLATKLQSCGLVMNPNEVFAFGRAFGSAQPLFSFIDVGQGKERADHKIRETLRVFLPNAQCKHVFFGPTLDKGYLVVLEPYKRDYVNRLSLIETRPAEPGFRELGFPLVRFPDVFRSSDLPMKAVTNGATPTTMPIRTASLPMQPNSTPFIPKSTSPAPSSDSSSSNTWAALGKSGTTSKTINIASKKTPVRPFALLNLYDERLDSELPRSDPGAEKRFADQIKTTGRKYCNDYHLSGNCDKGEYCDYRHGKVLVGGELLVLKHKARSRTCPQRGWCRDAGCTYGHHCRAKGMCGLYTECWFADTHHMDFQAAKKVYEDGSEEWIQAYLDQVRT